MTAPAVDLNASEDDLLAQLAAAFPAWSITRTERGWWATRGPLTSENLARAVSTTGAAELYVALKDAAR